MDKYENANETFDVEPIEVKKEVKSVEKQIQKFENSNEDIRKDYEYTRGNLYSIIEKGQEAINGILELAKRVRCLVQYMEVAGQLIKNVSDATDKLMDLQKKLKDVNEEKDKGPLTLQIMHCLLGQLQIFKKCLRTSTKI